MNPWIRKTATAIGVAAVALLVPLVWWVRQPAPLAEVVGPEVVGQLLPSDSTDFGAVDEAVADAVVVDRDRQPEADEPAARTSLATNEPTAVPRRMVPSTLAQRELFARTVLTPHRKEVVLAKLTASSDKVRSQLRDDLAPSQRAAAEAWITQLTSAKANYSEQRYLALEDYVINAPDLAEPQREKGQRGFTGELRRGLTTEERGYWGQDVDEVHVDFFLAYERYPRFAEARHEVLRLRQVVDEYCR